APELTLEERVSLYAAGAAHPAGETASRAPDVDQLAQFKGAADSMLKRNTSLEQRISLRLDAAGSGFNASEWLLLHGGIVLASGVLGLIIGGGNLLVGILFLAGGVVVPWLFL